MPASMVNNAFTSWSERTSVLWPKRRLSLTIAADTDYYVLYAPPGEDFFCFEPVDHPINAVNLPGGGEAHGMTVLAPGERLTRDARTLKCVPSTFFRFLRHVLHPVAQ